MNGEAIYIDETFIKIAKKTWYLFVFLSDKGNMLAFELVKQRKKDRILELFKKAEQRLGKEVRIMITDDFDMIEHRGNENTFIVQVSESVKKIHKKGK